MSEKIFAVCIGIIIAYTILALASFIYRAYWSFKLNREIKKFKKKL